MSDQPSPRQPSRRAWVLIVLVVAIISYALGAKNSLDFVKEETRPFTSSGKVSGLGSLPPPGLVKDTDFQEFWVLWDTLKSKFYKQPLDEQKMFYGAMSGLAASLGDPYTAFFEPQLAQEFSRSLEGKFEGIGAEIGIKGEQLQVVAPLPDSPAQKAGILSGDAILLINGTSTEGMTVERAVSLIRGKKGTKVSLSLGRLKTVKSKDGKETKEPERLEVSIMRDTIVVKSVRTKFPDDGIALVEINHFNSDTTLEFSKAVGSILAQDSKGIILDLRNNPGGFLDRSIYVASEWVGDEVVVVERRQGKITDEFRGTGRARLKGIPTIVLVNEGSASAAEIVAGALQDYGAAKLIGTKTFGKGSVQDYTELKDGMAVKITVAEWLTPKGRSINEIGIEPDILIQRTEDDYHADRDPQLEKALQLLAGGEASSAAPGNPAP